MSALTFIAGLILGAITFPVAVLGFCAWRFRNWGSD